jgi:hypothetical protein
MRPSFRSATLVAASLTLAAGGAAHADSAGSDSAPGHNKPMLSWYFGTSTSNLDGCAAAITTCTPTATSDGTTHQVSAVITLERRTPSTASDWLPALGYGGVSFNLPQPARKITATVHVTGIAPAALQAWSRTGLARASQIVGAQVFDSGCGGDATCGVPDGARVEVLVGRDDSTGGTDLGSDGARTDASKTQDISLTLAMPDGSDVPRGRISIAGFAAATGWLTTWSSCATATVCSPTAPQSGSARAALSATIDAIDVTVE